MTLPVLDIHLTENDAAAALRADVLSGLTANPKTLPPKWFYDERGSELFEQITELPEYYPTGAEREVLAAVADEIAATTGAETMVELGSGSSAKTRLLLDALRANGSLRRFIPLDVSAAALVQSTQALAEDYPGLEIRGVVGDFTRHLERLPVGGRRLVAFLGGTIGNLLPAERAEFFASVRATLKPGEWLLLGTDLVKDPDTLVRAYDDGQGVTAEFNRNVLRVLNRELAADFEVEAFEHVAVWDEDWEWIEMRLRATKAMSVRVEELGLEVKFDAGEELRTEVSAKFRQSGVRRELAATGFDLRKWWTDPAGRFGVSLARAEG
ncbi:L-histidine N(alpha)-methyltransferase [Crossiella sp. SN42]|uniref:L-histidine N(alpha)-methyltransferase n=1 Tax=Crossiella sp. SN42 TaxID=2944808 RepID=UPI00207C4439|nr:L-histidine N(alpha)-methyltransferase [Crossiella sp. SN42]MCO1577467.1 L-histidine N(alpha)-methyltransferase [Crossiella sp. SN42]